MSALLPLFLKLSGRRVVVVGGGNVATMKVASLNGTGADIVVVSPAFHPDLERAAVQRVQRPFEPSDLDGAWLVIAAATPEVNEQVSRAADARRIFNVAVDHPEVGTAYAGGTVRKGDVTVAISTDGKAPALAGLLREALEVVLPDDVHRWMDVARDIRAQWRAAQVPMAARRPLLLTALTDLYANRTSSSIGSKA